MTRTEFKHVVRLALAVAGMWAWTVWCVPLIEPGSGAWRAVIAAAVGLAVGIFGGLALGSALHFAHEQRCAAHSEILRAIDALSNALASPPSWPWRRP